ncbi:hypothetical protein [Paraburkholderia sp. RL17-337-BIB-A]|uniref:hypothetical protein n=1 Tax=Paraburkholderia sp. RL17-337-BIB-A TaxID=3031636 RepID=UPI0038BD5AD0
MTSIMLAAYEAPVYCALEARKLLSNPYVQQTMPPVDRLSFKALRDILERFEDARPPTTAPLRQPAAFAVPAVAKASVVAIKAILIGFAFIRRFSEVGFLGCGAFQGRFNTRANQDARATRAHAIPDGAIHVHATRDVRAIRGLASRRQASKQKSGPIKPTYVYREPS